MFTYLQFLKSLEKGGYLLVIKHKTLDCKATSPPNACKLYLFSGIVRNSEAPDRFPAFSVDQESRLFRHVVIPYSYEIMGTCLVRVHTSAEETLVGNGEARASTLPILASTRDRIALQSSIAFATRRQRASSYLDRCLSALAMRCDTHPRTAPAGETKPRRKSRAVQS
jgi:hypothetical protein